MHRLSTFYILKYLRFFVLLLSPIYFPISKVIQFTQQSKKLYI